MGTGPEPATPPVADHLGRRPAALISEPREATSRCTCSIPTMIARWWRSTRYYKPFPNLKVTAKVFDIGMAEKFSKDATLDAGEDSSTRVFTIPELEGVSGTYFVSLTLEGSGKTASRNFYWLSAKPETLDWEKSDWYHTPTKSFADYTALNGLPQVDLETTAQIQPQGATVRCAIRARRSPSPCTSGEAGPEGMRSCPCCGKTTTSPCCRAKPGRSRQPGAARRPARRGAATPAASLSEQARRWWKWRVGTSRAASSGSEATGCEGFPWPFSIAETRARPGGTRACARAGAPRYGPPDGAGATSRGTSRTPEPGAAPPGCRRCG